MQSSANFLIILSLTSHSLALVRFSIARLRYNAYLYFGKSSVVVMKKERREGGNVGGGGGKGGKKFRRITPVENRDEIGYRSTKLHVISVSSQRERAERCFLVKQIRPLCRTNE